jgi:uncharacterized protein
MKLTDFDIEFIKFKNEKATFHYKMDDAFFKIKENSLFSSGDIKGTVVCERNDGNISVKYELDGHMNMQCERCLNDIKVGVQSERHDVLKLTQNEDLLKEENYLSVNYQVYNIYDSIYEQICLDLPTRKICKHSLNHEECEIQHPEAEDTKEVDERWADLKKLIKK